MIEIVFLGTGSAIPNPQRHLPGVALIREGAVFLFDCGEGTQMQYRSAKLRPGRLRFIFVSHFHGDHLFGLPGLLTSLHMSGCRQELHLFGPAGIASYIQFHQELCSFELEFELKIHEIDENSDPVIWRTDAFHVEWRPLAHRIFTIGYALVESDLPGRFDVDRANALGIPEGPLRGVLQSGQPVTLPNGTSIQPEDVVGPSRPGLKIAYCLDTAPCPGEEQLAQDADALIADATFRHQESVWAHQTGHSTVFDAAQLARRCNVRQLFLTHFSNTIQSDELNQIAEEAKSHFPNSTVATDLSRFTIKPIWKE